jgi:YebC/PmpR family DNA-binding regulatory protein
MSGHSKWSTIKRKKGAIDAKRGRIFTRLIKEITIAARIGGGDQNGNPRLRTAVLAAKADNMPKDNIDRAIKKGTGELEGFTIEEYTYEGYGPGGVAIMVEVMTDNKNRATAELRHAFTKHNGNMGEAGCVAWMFQKKGVIQYDHGAVEEEKLMEVALDAGADDVRDEGSVLEVTTDPKDFFKVKEKLDASGLPPCVMAEVSMVPQNTIKVVGKEAEQVLRLMEALEDLDDTQKVYANFDIPEEEMDRLSQ